VAYVTILALFVSCRAGTYGLVAKKYHRFVIISAAGVCITVTMKGSRCIEKGYEERNAAKEEKETKLTHTCLLAIYPMKTMNDF
jgi:hypothetical protein